MVQFACGFHDPQCNPISNTCHSSPRTSHSPGKKKDNKLLEKRRGEKQDPPLVGLNTGEPRFSG